MSLDKFKSFVKSRPDLASYVANGSHSWQEFYELYSMYGENSNVWNKYLQSSKTITLKDLFENIKNIDMREVQESILSMQKGIKYIEGLVKTKEDLPIKRPQYEKRPLYKYFDD